MTKKVVAICSGGMDSVALLHFLKARNYELHVLSADYGQKHKKELWYAMEAAERLKSPWKLVDLTSLTPLLSGSALTDSSVEVPDGHYAAATMKQTVVPNRNAILLSIATGWAVALGADRVATAVHAGDHAIYPDCRPQFIYALSDALRLATEGFSTPGFGLSAPFIHMTKSEIVSLGDGLEVPWKETWSCYKGGDIHCGTCGTCTERREAFLLARVKDPTKYAASLEETFKQ